MISFLSRRCGNVSHGVALEKSGNVNNMKRNANYWIDTLQLEPHPEGGYFRSTFRSDITIAREALPQRFNGPRPAGSSIYFLVDRENFSAFHRIQADEGWHFYAGSTLLVHIIDSAGVYSELRLGSDPEAGESFHGVVRSGVWFAARPKDPSPADPAPFALVGCALSPGFDFDDFEIAKRADLLRQFPQHRALIQQLTRG